MSSLIGYAAQSNGWAAPATPSLDEVIWAVPMKATHKNTAPEGRMSKEKAFTGLSFSPWLRLAWHGIIACFPGQSSDVFMCTSHQFKDLYGAYLPRDLLWFIACMQPARNFSTIAHNMRSRRRSPRKENHHHHQQQQQHLHHHSEEFHGALSPVIIKCCCAQR